jgi:hypothetical protein
MLCSLRIACKYKMKLYNWRRTMTCNFSSFNSNHRGTVGGIQILKWSQMAVKVVDFYLVKSIKCTINWQIKQIVVGRNVLKKCRIQKKTINQTRNWDSLKLRKMGRQRARKVSSISLIRYKMLISLLRWLRVWKRLEMECMPIFISLKSHWFCINKSFIGIYNASKFSSPTPTPQA